MRYSIIDGFRGFFLLFMCVVHLDSELDVLIGKLNHHAFGWVEDAQGFVFISGLVVGMVYGGTLIKRGRSALSQRIWSRIRTLFTWHGATILGFAVLAVILAGRGYVPDILSDYNEAPAAFTAASLLLVAGTDHMGILPLYIVLLAATPGLLIVIRNGHSAAVLLGSGLVWFLGGQTILLDQITVVAEAALARQGAALDLGIYFNVLGWQILFVTGLVCGYHMAAGTLDLSFLNGPQARGVFFVAVAGIVALAALDRLVNTNWIFAEFSAAVIAGERREDFSALHLLAFALDLYVVVWILNAGRGSGIPLLALAAQVLHRVMTCRPLVFLGQHSLAVFTGHLVIVYAVSIALNRQPVSEIQGSLILLTGVAMLFVVAWLNAARTRRRSVAVSPNRISGSGADTRPATLRRPVPNARDWRRPLAKGTG